MTRQMRTTLEGEEKERRASSRMVRVVVSSGFSRMNCAICRSVLLREGCTSRRRKRTFCISIPLLYFKMD